MTLVAHALVSQETGEYYDKAFEIFCSYRDSLGASVLKDWPNQPGHAQFSDRMKGIANLHSLRYEKAL
ncbi:hypothetical protein XU18_0709 [Perkinsela sp. CCAP 1560/4]|nr:hypothetical protein XU18_4515 [Perkinsela sp. CCAP 1560/4]KNH08939.1 hypothetical protein XU18_0709 [Perkinsela sp. CCAP 1560/4]|eukprot:KNH04305.1 hypothetical protein XU18_4515 [Perkinsela sp. CCAP 1560/4]